MNENEKQPKKMSQEKKKIVDEITRLQSKILSINQVLKDSHISDNLRSELLSDLRINENLLSDIIEIEFSKID